MKKSTNSFLFSLSFILFIFSGTLASAQKSDSIKVPVIKDGQTQVIPAFEDASKWRRHDLWVETDFDSDGDGNPDRVHVDVTRPEQTDSEKLKLPVIYETSPYYAGVASEPDIFWDVRHELGEQPPTRNHPGPISRRDTQPVISNSLTETWVPRGFIVVHSSSPGTGLSEGSPTVGGKNESLAPKAVIDWLNGRADGYTTVDGNEKVEAYWSTGNVGMTGTSYNGTLPLAAATTGVEGLKAIIPVAPNTSYYHYYRSNGLVRSPGGYLGEDIDVLYDFIHSGSQDHDAYSDSTVRDTDMANGMDRLTGDYNDFWAGRDYLNHLQPLKAAMLMSHGFNDWNVMPEHSYRIYKALKEKGVPTQIYYHQQGHGGPPPLEMMNRWFTRYLFEVENGVENDPRAWIVREHDERSEPTAYKDYPNPDAVPVEMHLTAGAPQRGGLTTKKQTGQGTESLIDNFSFSSADLAQAEWTDHRLMYVTQQLSDSLHISGTPQITIKVASNKPAANLSVMLVSLPWNEGRGSRITDNIITRGWADPQNHKSLSKSEPLVPDTFYEISFDLQPDDQIIPPGQQIGLMIFSSDREFTLHPDPGTKLTIDLDATTLTLPIVGDNSSF